MDRLHSDEQLFLINQVFENAREAVVLINSQQEIIAINRIAAELLGYQKSELLKKHYLSLYKRQEFKDKFLDFTSQLEQLEPEQKLCGNHYAERKDGTVFPVTFSAYFVMSEIEVESRYCVISFADNSALVEKQSQIDTLKHFHNLTQLPNTNYLRKELYKLYEKKCPIGIFLINLSGFSFVNSHYSFEVSDKLLVEASKRIQKVLPSNTFIAHISVDRFIILYTKSIDKKILESIANTLLLTFSAPFSFNNTQNIECGINIGIATNNSADTPQKLRQYVYTALIKSESQGNNSFSFYSHADGYNIKRNLEITNAIKHALKDDNFYLVYQPKISIPDEKLVAFEALIRLEDPFLGTIYPDEFIHIAEKTGLIHDINMWVAREACRQGRVWLDEDKDFERISINISSDEFQYRSFIDEISQILQQTNFPAKCLEVEITETMMMTNPVHVSIMLERLKALGLYLSIDDFGSGYSSYAYLLDLPIDCIKIDKSFIDNICHDKKIRKINQSIISLAKAIDAEVVAEGVEEKHQVQVLAHLKCDMIQGYFYSRPQLPQDLDAFFNHEFHCALN